MHLKSELSSQRIQMGRICKNLNCILNHDQMWFESDLKKKKIRFHVGFFFFWYVTNKIFAGSLNIVKRFPISNGVSLR